MNKLVRMDINPRSAHLSGRIDPDRVDATSEADIARHMAEDDAQAMADAARYARQVRERLGLSRAEFARRICVSEATVRRWEHGQRRPTGAARALLKLLDAAPETALRTLR